MKNYKKLQASLVCLLLGATALVSCLKDSEVPFQGIADVVIQDLKTDAGVKYGVFIYITANQDIQSATVTEPGTGGKVYQLTATKTKEQFVFIPQASDYTSTLPVKGDYAITVTSVGGETITGKDVVGDETLSPIAIKTATMASQNLKVTWDLVSGADAYLVKLYSADRSELLYISDFLLATDAQHEIGLSNKGWLSSKQPVVNTNYVIELIGVRPETGVTTDKGNNLQFLTIDSKTIKWE
jgi:hypothetical protein